MNGANIANHIRNHLGQLGYILLAELSLLVTSFVVNQNTSSFSFPEQKIVSSILFGCICLLGIVAGVSPSWCCLRHQNEQRNDEFVAGHHPNCGNFNGHTVNLGGRVFCAGCSGLVIGASIALILLVSGSYPLKIVTGFYLGIVLTGLGLAQHLIDLGSGWLHLLLNIGLVTGAWFMFGAIQLRGLSFFVSAYFLSVTVFWIYVRICVSQLKHVSVCNGCSVNCRHRFS